MIIGQGLGTTFLSSFPFSVADAYAAYAENSLIPTVIADFAGVNNSGSENYLDAAGNTAFDDMFTFTRASTAMMVNSSGNLVEVTSGTPRRNAHLWDGSAYQNEGILLESEARTNLDPNSDDLSAWTTSNTTVAKDETGADGVSNSAHSITASANNGTALEQITAASADHAWGCLMKRVTGTGTVEVTVDGGTTWVDVTSDINSSEFVQVSTGPGITVTNPEFGVRLGTSGDKVAVQVSQLEPTSNYVSSPIPTSGSTVTRAAETLAIASANMDYDATAMSFDIEGKVTYADTNTEEGILYWDASGSELIEFLINHAGGRTGWIQAEQKSIAGGTKNARLEEFISPGVNQQFNMAARYTTTELQVAFNGASSSTTTTTHLPDLSSADFEFGQSNSSLRLMAYISQFRQWPENIATAGIEGATS